MSSGKRFFVRGAAIQPYRFLLSGGCLYLIVVTGLGCASHDGQLCKLAATLYVLGGYRGIDDSNIHL